MGEEKMKTIEDTRMIKVVLFGGFFDQIFPFWTYTLEKHIHFLVHGHSTVGLHQAKGP